MKKYIIGIVVLFSILIFWPLFIQRADEQSIIVRMGKYNRTVSEPGISWKLPVIETRIEFTKRLVEYDSPPVSVVTKDKKTLIFDTVAYVTIVDPYKFYIKFKSISGVQQWLDDIVYAAVRTQAGKFLFDDLIYADRQTIINESVKYTNRQANEYGIDVKTIQFKRTMLPKDNESAVYSSMIADRNQVAAQLRAEGEAKYVEIMSKADMEYTAKTSTARKKAEEIKGEADKRAQYLISQTTSVAPDLYRFMKTMDFYKKVIPGTPIILKPSGGILDYLKGVQQ
jgi:membrane protease subunit HflC